MDGLVKLSADWLLILPDIALLILLAIVMLVDLFIGLKHKKAPLYLAYYLFSFVSLVLPLCKWGRLSLYLLLII